MTNLKATFCCLVAAASISCIAVRARADLPPSRAQARLARRKVAWDPDWPTFGLGEYIVTGASLAATGAIIVFGKEGETNWSSPILFDDDVRDGLRLSTASGRRTAQLVSNVFYYGPLLYPYLVDSLAVAWLGHGSPKVAAQMALMDTEAFAITGLLSFISNATIRRERPYVRECDPDKPDPGFPGCARDGRNEGFFSGHTAIGFTGAALTCMHHANLPLYGENGVGDTIACVTMLAGATTGGVMRLMADKHYATDVITGAAIGLASGILVPWFHYRNGTSTAEASSQTVRWYPAPMLSSSNIGIGAFGVF